MCVLDGAWGDATLTWATAGALAARAQERGVPPLDVARGQLLQRHGAEARQDLVLEQLGVALRRLGRDRAHSLPVCEPGTQVLADGELAGADVAAVGDLRQQAGEFGLGFAAGTLEGSVDGLAPAAVAVDVVFDLPGIDAAPADMT